MTIPTPDDDQEEDRRKFLATCEKRFAAVTPPTITVLLSTPSPLRRMTATTTATISIDN